MKQAEGNSLSLAHFRMSSPEHKNTRSAILSMLPGNKTKAIAPFASLLCVPRSTRQNK